MGLGVGIRAPLKRRRKHLRDLKAVGVAALEAIDDPLLASMARVVEIDDLSLGLHLHPAAEYVYFELRPDELKASSKTSTVGPGYHAYVVELLERMGERHGLAWSWEPDDDDEDAIGDECGYHADHDFEALQQQMQAFLRALVAIDDEGETDNVRICLPFDFDPVRPGEICSPAGPLTRTWLRDVAAASEARIAELAPTFFAWWTKGCDAAFWNGYGRSLCWTEIPWHPPATDAERRSYDHAIAAFARSLALDPQVMLPDLEVAELKRLRDAPVADAGPPRPSGIGFRRGDMRWHISAGWTLQAPGYWYDDLDDGSLVLWFKDKTIRACSFTVEGRAATDILASSTKSHRDVADDQLVRWESRHLIAEGVYRWTDDGDGYWMLESSVAMDGSLCVLTICFEDPADRAWAETTLRSVKRPPP